MFASSAADIRTWAMSMDWYSSTLGPSKDLLGDVHVWQRFCSIIANNTSPRTPWPEILGTALGSGVGAGVGVGVGAGVGAGLVSACATGCVGASVVGGRLVVWFCGTVGAGCTELGCPTAGVFSCPVGTGLLCGVVTEGVEGAVATMFCVGVGATGLADTALSRSLPPPPPQAASTTLSAVTVQVVRRMRGCLVAMLRLQGATYCTRLTMEESYSWPWAVPDVSAKKHQSQQGEGRGLSCGSDERCRRAELTGSLSRLA